MDLGLIPTWLSILGSWENHVPLSELQSSVFSAGTIRKVSNSFAVKATGVFMECECSSKQGGTAYTTPVKRSMLGENSMWLEGRRGGVEKSKTRLEYWFFQCLPQGSQRRRRERRERQARKSFFFFLTSSSTEMTKEIDLFWGLNSA